MEINLVGERSQSGKARGEERREPSPALGESGTGSDVLALFLVRSQHGPVKLITASLVHRCKTAKSVAAVEEKSKELPACCCVPKPPS